MDDQNIQFVFSSSVSTNQTAGTQQPTSSQQNVGESPILQIAIFSNLH
jgi:hypothetical protein